MNILNLLWFLALGILLSCVLHYFADVNMWGQEHDIEMVVVGFVALIYFFSFSNYKLNEWRFLAEQEAARIANAESARIAKAKAHEKAERETARKSAEEERRRAAETHRDLERNSYYYLETINGNSVVKGPIDLKHMLKLFKTGKVSLLTSVKFGLNTELKPLREFKELAEGLNEFL